MALVTDVHADVVQQRAVLEPLALGVAEAVDAPGLIEDVQGDPGDLLGVFRPVSASLAQLDDAAAADVGVAFDFPNPGAVAPDVVEHEAFAQREVAQRELVGAEPADDGVEEHRAGDGEIGTSRIHAWNAQPLGDVGLDQPLPQPAQRLRRHSPVADVLRHLALFRDRHRTEAQDRA